MHRWIWVVGALLLLVGTGRTPAQEVRDAAAPSAYEVVDRAFANFYGCDTRGEIELVTRSRGGGERRRVLEAAAKHIDGKRHGVSRVVSPPDLRGMSFLVIERERQSHDAFIYLPSQRRVRRITTAQRGDAFFGSDLTYEDIEERRVEDFDLELLPSEDVGGERAYRVRARPRIEASYAELVAMIAQADYALLEVRYFKRAADQPYRVIRMARDRMHREDGHVMPQHIAVENLSRGSTTEVHFRKLEINPEIEDRIFTPGWLERGRNGRLEKRGGKE